MDRRAWWATVYRVKKSWTWLKWLCMLTYHLTHGADALGTVGSQIFRFHLESAPSALWFLGLPLNYITNFPWFLACRWQTVGLFSFCDCMSQYFIIILLYICLHLLLILFMENTNTPCIACLFPWCYQSEMVAKMPHINFKPNNEQKGS